MNAPATSPETEAVLLLDLTRIRLSSSNPRRRETPDAQKKLEELAASITKHDVIEPVIVRSIAPAAGFDHELVVGSRRVAASRIAGKTKIRAIVRNMEDAEVLEIQLAENIDRADMHPLDEADGFARLLKFPGYDVQRLADKMGRSPSYVAQRLKLCELGKEARAALDKGTISLGVALLVARVPASLQQQALEDIEDEKDYGTGLPTVDEAKKLLEHRYLLRLDRAPFDITDGKLVPAAGACTACPKRTGAQRELFPDVKSADLCTDLVCHRGKLDALWKIRVKQAKAGGTPVLEGKEAEKAMSYGSAYRKLDDEEYVSGKHKTVRQLLGKHVPPVTLARDSDGQVVELVKKTDVQKVLEEHSPKLAKSAGSNSDGDRYKAQQKREEQKHRRRQQAVAQALALVIQRASKLGPIQTMDIIVRGLIKRSWNDSQMAVIRRRKLEEPKAGEKTRVRRLPAEDRLLRYAEKLSTAELCGLGIELALEMEAPARHRSATPVWGATLKTLGIDFAKIEAEIAGEQKAKKAGKKPKGKQGAMHFSTGGRTACGADPGTSVGSGVSSSPKGVTCKNCMHAAGIVNGEFIDEEHAQRATALAKLPSAKRKRHGARPRKAK